jgi:hypothetical protein
MYVGLTGDKKVTQQEFGLFLTGLLRATFDRVDENKNGKLDAGEVATLVLLMIEGIAFKVTLLILLSSVLTVIVNDGRT